MNLACSKRMKAAIPLWLPFYDGVLSAGTRRQLLTVSAATIDRLLAPMHAKHGKIGLTTTRPGSLLKKHISIKTNQWDETRPGFLEADTVAHCGSALGGMFVYTVNTVDIATQWTEQRAVWGKGERGVREALHDIEHSLPFRIRGFDCDNGSESLNWTILKYWVHRKIPVQYTRSREYQKNDNAHIEGKNWTHVRQYIGYKRLDQPELASQMNGLYTSQWRLLFNYFLPSMKLIAKHREGSRTVKTYEPAKTPFQKVLESSDVDHKTKRRLQHEHESLNPFELQQQIARKISGILDHATPTAVRKVG